MGHTHCVGDGCLGETQRFSEFSDGRVAGFVAFGEFSFCLVKAGVLAGSLDVFCVGVGGKESPFGWVFVAHVFTFLEFVVVCWLVVKWCEFFGSGNTGEPGFGEHDVFGVPVVTGGGFVASVKDDGDCLTGAGFAEHVQDA